jgi:hypothetical protein
LFVDYGLTYDRSMYPPNDAAITQKKKTWMNDWNGPIYGRKNSPNRVPT